MTCDKESTFLITPEDKKKSFKKQKYFGNRTKHFSKKLCQTDMNEQDTSFMSVLPKTFSLCTPFQLQIITTDPHILAHLNIVSRLWVSKIKYSYYRNDFRQMLTHTSSICINALQDFTSIIKTIAHCVCTGSSFIRYSNGHTK